MPVSDQHPEYSNSLMKWQLVEDACAGSDAIKSRGVSDGGGSITGTRYLPMPNPEDLSTENRARYEDYKLRANFFNATGMTKTGMLGMVFRLPPVMELPPTIDYLQKSTDGGALTLEQLSKGVISDCLVTGRSGLLTDYPVAPPGLTQAEISRLNLRANILRYPAQSVINWRTIKEGGIKKMSLVVLAEPTEKLSEDGFSFESVVYHRVLRLINGVYVQELWDEDDEIVDFGEGVTRLVPRKADGSIWNEIPFTFVGTADNDEKVDKAALYDIAEENVSHYRNSADYEESSFMVGQPTPFITGLTQSWVDGVLDGKVTLGSRAAVMLPADANMGLIQADANQMPIKGMEHKEAQMVKLGARLIEDRGGNETVVGVQVRFAGQNSIMSSIVGNVEDALNRSLAWALEFMGGTGDVSIKLNRKFHDADINPQELMANIQLLDRGIIGKSDLRARLRKVNIIEHDRTDESIDEEAGTVDPLA